MISNNSLALDKDLASFSVVASGKAVVLGKGVTSGKCEVLGKGVAPGKNLASV